MLADTARTVQDRPRDIDPVSKIVLAAFAVAALLIAAYVIIDYAARVDEAGPRRGVFIPSSYREAVKAIIVTTGNECREICDVEARADRLKVSCDVGASAHACLAPRSYTVRIAPTPQPSR